MAVNKIELTIQDGLGDTPWSRHHRIKEALAYAVGIEGINILLKIDHISDDKGILQITWRSYPNHRERGTMRDAWESVTEYNITHLFNGKEME